MRDPPIPEYSTSPTPRQFCSPKYEKIDACRFLSPPRRRPTAVYSFHLTIREEKSFKRRQTLSPELKKNPFTTDLPLQMRLLADKILRLGLPCFSKTLDAVFVAFK